MSIEAITYAKTLNVNEAKSRLALIIIGENTFNDTGLCKVGQSVLVQETRIPERTLRRILQKLEDVDKVVKVTARPTAGGGRLSDTIELVGFLEWLERARKVEPAKMAVSNEPASSEPAKNAEPASSEPANTWPVRYKDKYPVLKTPVLSEGDGFEDFWLVYPRRVCKGKARELFQKLTKQGKATGAEIVAGAKAYAVAMRGKEQQYIAHPTTWLNAERWTDELRGSATVKLQQTIAKATNGSAYDAGPGPLDTQKGFAMETARAIVRGEWSLDKVLPNKRAAVERCLAEIERVPA